MFCRPYRTTSAGRILETFILKSLLPIFPKSSVEPVCLGHSECFIQRLFLPAHCKIYRNTIVVNDKNGLPQYSQSGLRCWYVLLEYTRLLPVKQRRICYMKVNVCGAHTVPNCLTFTYTICFVCFYICIIKSLKPLA